MASSTELDFTSRLQIHELYARYTHAFDEGRADELASLFTDDGVFQREGAQPVRGRTALAELVRVAAERNTDNRHLVSAVVVEPTGSTNDTATGTAYVQVVSITADSLRLVAIGRYHDEFVRDDNTWRFRSRHFSPLTSSELNGMVLAAATPAGA